MAGKGGRNVEMILLYSLKNYPCLWTVLIDDLKPDFYRTDCYLELFGGNREHQLTGRTAPSSSYCSNSARRKCTDIR